MHYTTFAPATIYTCSACKWNTTHLLIAEQVCSFPTDLMLIIFDIENQPLCIMAWTEKDGVTSSVTYSILQLY